MSPAPKPLVGVFFGGRSPEHEVAVISALQAMAAIDRSRWRVVPVYLSKDGSWWTGERLSEVSFFQGEADLERGARQMRIEPGGTSRLRLAPMSRSRWSRPDPIDIDIAVPVMHGGSGEDGGLQGLCETLDVPYAGSGVLASALAMDKAAAKHWCGANGLPVVPSVTLREADWEGREEAVLEHVLGAVGLPAIVKPARLGSSIGISRATGRARLEEAIEEAFRYDGKILVERAVPNLRELNCSVLDDGGEIRASVLEEPVGGELLSFSDKYMSGASGKSGAVKQATERGMASLDRRIPAPVDEETGERVRELARRAFRAFGCAGVVRIDFLMDGSTGEVFLNEINTIPGSLSFYLWDPSGLDFAGLMDCLIEGALRRHHDRTARVRSHDVNLLSEKDLGGLKGAKGRG